MAALLALGSAQAAQADVFVGGTNVWTIVGAPAVQPFGTPQLVAVTFSNHLAVDVTAIVIMVLRNGSNQTVYYTTGTLSLSGGPSGAIGSAYLVESGVPTGTYTATFFAFTFGGVAVSLPTTIALAVTVVA